MTSPPTTAGAPGPLFAAFEELRDYAQDLANAGYQTVADALRRLVARLDTDPIRSHLTTILPVVDFDSWYSTVSGTHGPMVGSGEIEWPLPTPERVAMQAELLRRFASGKLDILSYSMDFHYVANDFNSNLAQFMEQTLNPFYRDLLRLSRSTLEAEDPQQQAPDASTQWNSGAFISPDRLSALRALPTRNFDYTKLIRLCEELDTCGRTGCLLAVAALTRALLDHVPPVFGVSSFAQVANNYQGSRSFRESMQHLEGSARRIGDAHLHVQIRQRETLPTQTQVNFANDLDVLLAEVIRIGA